MLDLNPLKDEKISIQSSSLSENLKTFADTIHLVHKIVDHSQLTKSNLKKYVDLQLFMDSHCNATHYGLQVKKCNKSDWKFCSVFHSNRLEVNYNQEVAIRRVKDEEEYICVAALLVEKSPFDATVVVCRSLSCTLSPMETTYYATKSIRSPEICSHCGGKNRLANNNTIKELKSRFATVRPKCCICYNAEKEPATRGPNNNPKRKKV